MKSRFGSAVVVVFSVVAMGCEAEFKKVKQSFSDGIAAIKNKFEQTTQDKRNNNQENSKEDVPW